MRITVRWARHAFAAHSVWTTLYVSEGRESMALGAALQFDLDLASLWIRSLTISFDGESSLGVRRSLQYRLDRIEKDISVRPVHEQDTFPFTELVTIEFPGFGFVDSVRELILQLIDRFALFG